MLAVSRDAMTIGIEPFEHFILDEALPPELAAACEDEVARITPEEVWHRKSITYGDRFLEVKDSLGWEYCDNFPAIRSVREHLRHPQFISRLTTLFGIQNLKFDPHGGGIHRIRPGGLLANHIDFNVSPDGKWRRLNVLIYLNRCNGGDLRLFHEDGFVGASITPKPGRMVAFRTTETSWHGHPTPLIDGPPRKSLAAYYFTHEKPENAGAPHETVFFDLMQEGAYR